MTNDDAPVLPRFNCVGFGCVGKQPPRILRAKRFFVALCDDCVLETLIEDERGAIIRLFGVAMDALIPPRLPRAKEQHV